MNRNKKRFVSLLLALIMTLGLCVPSMAATPAIDSALGGSASHILSAVRTPQVGSIGGEWAVIGLARSGYAVPQSYWDDYYAAVEKYVKDCKGVLHEKKYTEYSRVALALTAIGADPTNVAGYDLLAPLGDFNKTVWQGINGPIWALIALDSGNYDMPISSGAATQATRQMYVDEIISRQLEDGGWSLTDKSGSGQSDPDVTGMALQALSRYQDQAAVRSATERAITCLSKMQDSDGGYSSWGSTNAESVVQVIVGLLELGIPLDDGRFVKNGNTLLDDLLSYRQSDGSFLHTSGGAGSNQMASEQGLYALAAVNRVSKGLSTLYRMDDVTIKTSGSSGDGTTGLPGKHPDVQRRAVTSPGVTFDDIASHENRTAVDVLAARGVINGRGNGLFDPNATMTRAEYAAIVVRGLGLTPQANGAFSDVPSGTWFAPYVGAASKYGIIEGIGGGLFDPGGTITRQEAAVMTARAAKLCGMDTEMTDYEIRNMLAQFGDYVTVAKWAQTSMAFCYSRDILDRNELDIRPAQPILRCEIAQMLFNMLGGAKLL